MRRTLIAFSVLAILVFVLSACASESEPELQTTSAPETTAGEPSTETTEGTAPDEATATTEGSEEPRELARLTYRLDFLAGPPHIPYVYGVTSGIYEQHGLDMRVLEGRGSALTFQTVASGADPLGNVDGGVYALGKAESPDAGVMVGVWTQENPADLLFFCDQGIESPEDLAGKTIAAAPGDGVVALLPAMLGAHGMTMDDLTVISVAPAARVSVVIEGDADIGVGYGHASSVRYILAGREAGREVCYLRLSEWGVNTLGHGTMVNAAFMEENPEMVRAFVEGTQEAIAAAVENPDDAINGMLEYFPTTVEERETMELGWQVFAESIRTENTEGCPIGWVAQEDAATTLELLTEYLGLQTDLTPDDFYTNEFTGDC